MVETEAQPEPELECSQVGPGLNPWDCFPMHVHGWLQMEVRALSDFLATKEGVQDGNRKKSNQELRVVLICWSEELRSRSGVAQAGDAGSCEGHPGGCLPPSLHLHSSYH